MAWRIDEQVVRGEIDNRKKGCVTGCIWLYGRDEPVVLNLNGNCLPDLAGCQLTFTNPKAKAGDLEGFATVQNGSCGDMTASRKNKIPETSINELDLSYPEKPILYHWGNVLFLEWYSELNGRVVIESADYNYKMTLPQWCLSAEEAAQQETNNLRAMTDFMETLNAMMDNGEYIIEPVDMVEDDTSAEVREEEMIDRILHINDLKLEAEKLTGDTMIYQNGEAIPLEVEEQFWQNLVDIEKAPTISRRELLALDGFIFKKQHELSDDEIGQDLWRLIHALAEHNHYLEQTNHLSDRELYTLLLERVLEEQTQLLSKETAWCVHLIICEYGSLDECQTADDIYLAYYADDEWRAQWALDFPEYKIPNRVEPLYNRDVYLPKREAKENSMDDEMGEEFY